jgi:LPXTG-motif cell wall-anchored protein
MLCVSVTPANADLWNKKTNVSFSGPVEIPGNVVLPAGKYVIKLMDSMSNRHIVQFWNEDEDKLLATILAISKQRLAPAEDSVFSFYEVQENTPQKLESWFYPGTTIGQEFAYPKDQALEIAKAAGKEVPIASADKSGVSEMATPDGKTRSLQSERTSVSSFAPADATRPTGARVVPAAYGETRPNTLLAQAQPPSSAPPNPNDPADRTEGRDANDQADRPVTPQAGQPATADPNDPATIADPEGATLPATGSFDPMLLTMGGTMLLAGLGVRMRARRRR